MGMRRVAEGFDVCRADLWQKGGGRRTPFREGLIDDCVRGRCEDALRQIGVPNRALTPDELAQTDLSIFTTIVVGPRAYAAHPELLGESARLLDFARNGGTVVVLNGQHNTRLPTLLAYPVALSRPFPEHITAAGAPVTPLEPRSRLLTWPNHIGTEDWGQWVRERALFVPTTAYIVHLPVLRSERGVYPAGWTSPRTVVEQRRATAVGRARTRARPIHRPAQRRRVAPTTVSA